MTETAVTDAPGAEGGRRRRLPRGAVIVGLLGVVWFLFGAAGGSYQGKLSSVQKNDNAAYLPSSAESTKVDTESQLFQSVQTIPGFVVYQRAGGLTSQDRSKIAADAAAFRAITGVAGDQVTPAEYSKDGTTANIAVPLVGKQGNVSVQGNTLVKVEKKSCRRRGQGRPPAW